MSEFFKISYLTSLPPLLTACYFSSAQALNYRKTLYLKNIFFLNFGHAA